MPSYLEDLKPKEGILLVDTVLNEVAKESGFELLQVREMWELHREYLEQQMDKEDTDIIRIPHLGRMFFNAYQYRNTYIWNSLGKVKGYAKKWKHKMDQAKRIKEEAYPVKWEKFYHCPQVCHPGLNNAYKFIMRSIGIKKVYGNFNTMMQTLDMFYKGTLMAEVYNKNKAMKKEYRQF